MRGPEGRPPNAAQPGTRISCRAALDEAARAPFSKERRMECAKASKFHRKSGGGTAENGFANRQPYRDSIFTLPSEVWMVSGVPPPFSFPRNSWPDS